MHLSLTNFQSRVLKNINLKELIYSVDGVGILIFLHKKTLAINNNNSYLISHENRAMIPIDENAANQVIKNYLRFKNFI